MRRDYDLTGKKFGRLVVIKPSHTKNQQNWWECKCDCGNTTIVQAHSLNRGNTKSCGCYRRECQSLEPYRWIYNMILRGSKKRFNHLVTISFKDFLTFTEINKCHYCGHPVEWKKHQVYQERCFPGNGYYIDRKDNSIGYTMNNCVVCCSLCNMVKGKTLTYEEMKTLGDGMSKIQKTRQSRLSDINSTLPGALT